MRRNKIIEVWEENNNILQIQYMQNKTFKTTTRKIYNRNEKRFINWQGRKKIVETNYI